MTSLLYRGPSQLNGEEILVLAPPVRQSRGNTKTGAMLQTYILHRAVPPIEANRTGADSSICGTCPLRGVTTDEERGTAAARACYVRLHFAPNNLWWSYQAGKYEMCRNIKQLQDLGRDQVVRLGAYGDPAAVPVWVWENLLKHSKGWTGYTHAIGELDLLCMQSVERYEDAELCWARGQRTFRIVRTPADIDPEREVLCPADPSSPKKTTCFECRLCQGSQVKAKSIAIVAHGSGSGHLDTIIG